MSRRQKWGRRRLDNQAYPKIRPDKSSLPTGLVQVTPTRENLEFGVVEYRHRTGKMSNRELKEIVRGLGNWLDDDKGKGKWTMVDAYISWVSATDVGVTITVEGIGEEIPERLQEDVSNYVAHHKAHTGMNLYVEILPVGSIVDGEVRVPIGSLAEGKVPIGSLLKVDSYQPVDWKKRQHIKGLTYSEERKYWKDYYYRELERLEKLKSEADTDGKGMDKGDTKLVESGDVKGDKTEEVVESES